MGTDVPADRALLQGLIKVAAAYVHGVRGNPAGIARNLEGARARLVEADEDRPRPVSRGRGWTCRRCSPRSTAASPTSRRTPTDPTLRPTRPTEGARHERSRQPDPDHRRRRGRTPAPRGPGRGRSCSTSARRTSSPRSALPGALLVPTSTFTTRVDELPADRPLLVVCQTGVRSAAVAGFLIRTGRTDVVNVAGGMEAWERAGLPVRRGAGRAGRGRPAGLICAPASTVSGRGGAGCGAMIARVCSLCANAQPTRIRMMKLTVPTPAALQVAELLADLALDLQPGHRRADETELEERALRRGVGANARRRAVPPSVVPADEHGVRAGDHARRRPRVPTPGRSLTGEVLPLGQVARRWSGPPSRPRTWARCRRCRRRGRSRRSRSSPPRWSGRRAGSPRR